MFEIFCPPISGPFSNGQQTAKAAVAAAAKTEESSLKST